MNLTIASKKPVIQAEFELVHADLLECFPNVVRDLGGDPDGLMRRVGFEPSDATAARRLTYRSWITLLEHAATALQCPDFGMRLAHAQGGARILGPVSAVMKNSQTFGAALDYVTTHAHAHSLAASIRVTRDRAVGSWFVGHEILLGNLPNKRQAIEQALLLGHLNALAVTGGQARAREVRFRHQPLSARSTYRAYFGGTVRFDQKEDGVMFSDADLRCPIVHCDASRYAEAVSFIDSRFTRLLPPLHAQVRALIVRLIETRDCSNERVCAELGLHPRTLHRRLKLEGQSFEGIKDEVRRDVALRYLQETNHPLTFVAEKLGYAEQSVLTRSCMRWFAMSPTRLRFSKAA